MRTPTHNAAPLLASALLAPACSHCAAGRHDRCPSGRFPGNPCGCMARDATAHGGCPVGHFPTGSRVRTPAGRAGTIRETIDGPSGIEWCVWFDDAAPGSGLVAVRLCDVAEVAPASTRGAETWTALPVTAVPEGAAS